MNIIIEYLLKKEVSSLYKENFKDDLKQKIIKRSKAK